ncbi:MAG: hypothetical protein AAFW89_14365 [Bacteroidota bacterium]
MKKISLLLVLTLCALSSSAFAQHHLDGEHNRKFRAALSILHTNIPTDTPMGSDVLILPTIGIDMEYWINRHWGIGFHNDIELETFEVRTVEGEFVEREFPLVVTLDALWMPENHWVVVAGPGFEIAPHETYELFRLGLEYEVELGNHVDVSPNLIYDIRRNAFDTFSYGIGIGYRF